MRKDFTLLVKYLGIKIDETLNWKLNKGNPMLSNLRHFVNRKTLKSVHHVIFKPIYIIPPLLAHKI